MFILPDGTFWVQLLNFAIFFALLNVVFLSPVGKAIRKRRQYIDGVFSDYARYQAEGKSLREQAEQQRADARRDAEQTIAKARADASNQSAELAAQYASQVQATVEAAQRQAAAQLDRARAEQPQLVTQLSDAMLEQTLGAAAR